MKYFTFYISKCFKLNILIIFLVVAGCNSDGRKSFSINVRHFSGAVGLTLIYSIDQNTIQVDTNCDFANCKEQTVYKRNLTKGESDSTFYFIASLHLDTLKSSYKTKGISDGLYTKIKIKNKFLSSYTSTFDNYSTPTTDTLFKYIDNLVKQNKYRFFHWGEKE